MKNDYDYWLVLIIAFIVALIDFGLIDVLPYNRNAGSQGIFDFFIIALTGIVGVNLANQNTLPIWWVKPSRRYTVKIIVPGLILVATNAFVINLNQQALESLPWIDNLTPLSAILIAIRAALTEEIIFRLFLISVFVLVLRKIISTKGLSLVVGVIISSVIFGLIHPGFLIAFIYGIFLSYIYINSGLIVVFIIHFLADVIPFLLIALGYI